MPLLSINKQTNSLKRLKLFPPFMSFQLDARNRRMILDSNLRKKELNKLIDGFSEPKHILIFNRPLWFIYKGPEKLEEIAKWKFLGGRRYVKYNPDNKDHILAARSFRVILDVCLKNPISFSLIQMAVNSHLRVIITID